MAKQTNFFTYLLLFFGMAIFGSATPVSKLVTTSFNPWVGTGFRLVLALLLLLPVLFSQRDQFSKLKKNDYLVLFGIATVGVIGFTAALIFGMRHISGVAGSIIMSTTPAVTALGSFLFFHDKFGWRKITAIALAVAGVVLLNVTGETSTSGGSQVWLGMLLVFAAVCCEASYTLLGNRAMQDVSSLFVAAASGTLAAILFLPVLIWQMQDFSIAEAETSNLIALGWWGLGTMGLGSLIWYGGVSKVKGSIAAGFMGVMPVSALVLSYVLLDEKFKWIHMAGFALVFAGVLLIIWSHRRMMKEDKG